MRILGGRLQEPATLAIPANEQTVSLGSHFTLYGSFTNDAIDFLQCIHQ